MKKKIINSNDNLIFIKKDFCIPLNKFNILFYKQNIEKKKKVFRYEIYEITKYLKVELFNLNCKFLLTNQMDKIIDFYSPDFVVMNEYKKIEKYAVMVCPYNE